MGRRMRTSAVLLVLATMPANPLTSPAVAQAGAVADPRDGFWASKGYSLFWQGTPSEADIGTDVKAYFKDTWRANSKSYFAYQLDSAAGSFAITRAPDGSPSLEGLIKRGAYRLGNINGNQFGPKGPEKQIVASLELYSPTIGGVKQNSRGGTYIGFGIWGSADNVIRIPGGGVNRKDAWNFRVPLDKENRYFLYAYVPDKKNKYGIGWKTSAHFEHDRWNKIELELIQNRVGKKNGTVRLYINGNLLREVKGIVTRTKSTVRPKGFHMLLMHVGGADQNELYYLRNWRLYGK